MGFLQIWWDFAKSSPSTHRIHGTIVYFPAFTIINQLNVGKYTLYGSYWGMDEYSKSWQVVTKNMDERLSEKITSTKKATSTNHQTISTTYNQQTPNPTHLLEPLQPSHTVSEIPNNHLTSMKPLEKSIGYSPNIYWYTSWEFEPIWKILVKWDHFPKFRGENKKIFWKNHPRVGFLPPSTGTTIHPSTHPTTSASATCALAASDFAATKAYCTAGWGASSGHPMGCFRQFTPPQKRPKQNPSVLSKLPNWNWHT